MRCSLALVISLMGMGRFVSSSSMFLFSDLSSFPVTVVDVSQVFHAPQAGHFPNHFGDSLPHSLQKKTVFSLDGIVCRFSPLRDGAKRVGLSRKDIKKRNTAKLAGLFVLYWWKREPFNIRES